MFNAGFAWPMGWSRLVGRIELPGLLAPLWLTLIRPVILLSFPLAV
jgi:hypothetical protein